MTSRLRYLAPPLATAVLIESARRARGRAVGAEETRVFRAFNDAPDAMNAPVWVVMQSGSLAAVFVASAELARRNRTRTAAAALVAGVAVWGGVKAAKPFIGRGRPSAHVADVSVRGQAQTGLGYPSGHAAVATALALIATREASPACRVAALTVAGVTAGARMYVGAHLPLDVAGGVAIGVLSGAAALAVLDSLTPSDVDEVSISA